MESHQLPPRNIHQQTGRQVALRVRALIAEPTTQAISIFIGAPTSPPTVLRMHIYIYWPTTMYNSNQSHPSSLLRRRYLARHVLYAQRNHTLHKHMHIPSRIRLHVARGPIKLNPLLSMCVCEYLRTTNAHHRCTNSSDRVWNL